MGTGTLAIMQARIADEIGRDDLTDQIATCINDAISIYQQERFYFNETREYLFNLNQGQYQYSVSDFPDLANILKIDYVFAYWGGYPYRLDPKPPSWIETLNVPGITQGLPYVYCWYEQNLFFYPEPNAPGYSARVAAVIIVNAPSSDTDTTSPWMNDAEILIRSRAKYELAVHYLYDKDMERSMGGGALDRDGNPIGGQAGAALMRLREKTKRMTQEGAGYVRAMEF
jgi:hypothetical protein